MEMQRVKSKQDEHLERQCVQQQQIHERAPHTYCTIQTTIHYIGIVLCYIFMETKWHFQQISQQNHMKICSTICGHHNALAAINVVRFVRINATNLFIYDAIKLKQFMRPFDNHYHYVAAAVVMFPLCLCFIFFLLFYHGTQLFYMLRITVHPHPGLSATHFAQAIKPYTAVDSSVAVSCFILYN